MEQSNDIQTENKIIKRLGKSGIWAIILVFMIVVASLFASLIQSDFGNIRITAKSFDARDNQVVVYDLYKPKTVSEDNKAPLIVVIPGFQRSRETQAHLAIEFARRGFVVINIDPYSQGDSSSSAKVQGGAVATLEGYGAFDLINYVYDNDEVYPYVIKDLIGVTGHSAGGNAAYQAAVHFGKEAVNNNGVSKVHSIYISGYVLSINSSVLHAKSNMGMDYALYDEGAFRNTLNEDAPEGYNKADMRWAIEAHDFVNSGLQLEGEAIIPNHEEVTIGQIYGTPELRTMRIVHNSETIHAFQPYSVTATANNVEFFEIAMNFRSSIGAQNQTWMYKEIFTTISLIASLALLMPTAILLYRIPFFKKSLVSPQYNNEKRSRFDFVSFLVVFLITATFAALTYLPSSQLTLSLFKAASNSQNTWFFPQRMSNAVMVWAVISGLFSMGMFLVNHFVSLKVKSHTQNIQINHKREIKTWGIQLSLDKVLKTILLALIVVVSYFLLLQIIYLIFQVDYRFLFIMAARPLNFKTFLQLFMYVPFFLIFYLSNSVRVNGGQMHGGLKEGIKLTLAGFMNISGLVIILLIQYVAFARTGVIAFTELSDGTTQWLYVNILFTLIPVMFIMPFFNRWFYKISGNAYLGPIIITIIFIAMTLNNSVAYIPV